MLSIDPGLCSGDAQLLDRIGARLTSALAGAVGGRITVCIAQQDDEVVLEVRTARPGTWTRARQHVAIDNLLAQLSSAVAKRGGRLVNSVGSFGRLCTTVRIKSSARSAATTPLSTGAGTGLPTSAADAHGAVCKDV